MESTTPLSNTAPNTTTAWLSQMLSRLLRVREFALIVSIKPFVRSSRLPCDGTVMMAALPVPISGPR